MIAFVLAGLMMLAIMGGVIGFCIFAFREHRTAQKYRYLIRLHNAMPLANAHTSMYARGPQWKVSYKEKGKIKNVMIEADTEGEALKKFTKEYSVGYGNIVEVVNFSKC